MPDLSGPRGGGGGGGAVDEDSVTDALDGATLTDHGSALDLADGILVRDGSDGDSLKEISAADLLGANPGLGMDWPGVQAAIGSTRWHVVPPASDSTQGQSLNETHGIPLYIARQRTLDEMGCQMASAAGAGAVVRFGIYKLPPDGVPTDLVVDAGTDASDVTGLVSVTGIGQVLAPGLYVATATPQVASGGSFYCASNGVEASHFQVQGGIVPGTSHQSCFRMTGVSGALPASWSGVLTDRFAIRIGLRFSA